MLQINMIRCKKSLKYTATGDKINTKIHAKCESEKLDKKLPVKMKT